MDAADARDATPFHRFASFSPFYFARNANLSDAACCAVATNSARRNVSRRSKRKLFASLLSFLRLDRRISPNPFVRVVRVRRMPCLRQAKPEDSSDASNSSVEEDEEELEQHWPISMNGADCLNTPIEFETSC